MRLTGVQNVGVDPQDDTDDKDKKRFLCALLTLGLVPQLRDDSVVKTVQDGDVQNVLL